MYINVPGMFETQKSGNTTSLGEINFNSRANASLKAGENLVSGGVSVLYWHDSSVANVV